MRTLNLELHSTQQHTSCGDKNIHTLILYWHEQRGGSRKTSIIADNLSIRASLCFIYLFSLKNEINTVIDGDASHHT